MLNAQRRITKSFNRQCGTTRHEPPPPRRVAGFVSHLVYPTQKVLTSQQHESIPDLPRWSVFFCEVKQLDVVVPQSSVTAIPRWASRCCCFVPGQSLLWAYVRSAVWKKSLTRLFSFSSSLLCGPLLIRHTWWCVYDVVRAANRRKVRGMFLRWAI